MTVELNISGEASAIITPFWPAPTQNEDALGAVSAQKLAEAETAREKAAGYQRLIEQASSAASGQGAEALKSQFQGSVERYTALASRAENQAAAAAMNAQNIFNTKNLFNALGTDFQAKLESATAAQMTSSATGSLTGAASFEALKTQLRAALTAASQMVGGGFAAANAQLNENLKAGTPICGVPSLMPPALSSTGNMGGWGAVPSNPSQFADSSFYNNYTAGGSPLMYGMDNVGGQLDYGTGVFGAGSQGGTYTGTGATFDGTPGSLINTLINNAPAVGMLASTAMAVGDQAFQHLQQAAATVTAGVAGALGAYDDGSVSEAFDNHGVTGAVDSLSKGFDEGVNQAGGDTTSGARGMGSLPSSGTPASSTTPVVSGPETDDASSTTETSGDAGEVPVETAEDSATEPEASATPNSGGTTPSDTSRTASISYDINLSSDEGLSADVNTSLTSASANMVDASQVGTQTSSAAPAASLSTPVTGGVPAGAPLMSPSTGLAAPLGVPTSPTGGGDTWGNRVSPGSKDQVPSGPSHVADRELDGFGRDARRGIKQLAALDRALRTSTGREPLALAIISPGLSVYATADGFGFPTRESASLRGMLPAGVIPLAALGGKIPEEFFSSWVGAADPAGVLALAAQAGYINPRKIFDVARDPQLALPEDVEVVSAATLASVTPAAPAPGHAMIDELPKISQTNLPDVISQLARLWELPMDDDDISAPEALTAMHARRWSSGGRTPQVQVITIWWLLLEATDALVAGDEEYARAALRLVLAFPTPGLR